MHFVRFYAGLLLILRRIALLHAMPQLKNRDFRDLHSHFFVELIARGRWVGSLPRLGFPYFENVD